MMEFLIDLQSKSVDYFLYDRDFRDGRVNQEFHLLSSNNIHSTAMRNSDSSD